MMTEERSTNISNTSPIWNHIWSLLNFDISLLKATKTYTQLESQVHDCKDQVQDNIEKIVEKGPDLQNLQERADLLSENVRWERDREIEREARIYRYIVTLIKEGCTHIVNFMTPGTGQEILC